MRRALLRSLGENEEEEGEGGGERGGDEQVPTATAAPGAAANNYSYDFEGYSTPGVLSARARKASAVAAATPGETDDGSGGGGSGGGGSGASARIPASFPSSSSPHHHQRTQKLLAPLAQSDHSATTATMSGKDFFRAARARLPPARFEGLMSAVRALNGGRASRAAALAAASEALGGEGGGCADLVPVFEGLLSQRVPVD